MLLNCVASLNGRLSNLPLCRFCLMYALGGAGLLGILEIRWLRPSFAGRASSQLIRVRSVVEGL